MTADVVVEAEKTDHPRTGHVDRVHALDGARLVMAGSEVVTGADGVREMVVPTFLIEHGDDLVLIDSGLDPAAFGAPDHGPAAPYDAYRRLVVARCEGGTSVIDQLARHGKVPADVTYVIVTHDHFDHTGGLRYLPNATYVMGRADYDHVVAVLRGEADGPVVRPEDFAPIVEGRDWMLLDGDTDLFGDGSVRVIAMPGHTDGNVAILVRLPSRTILFTGDTAHQRDQYEAEIPMPLDADKTLASAAMGRMKELAAAEQAEVWIGHEIEDWDRFGAPTTLE